MNGKVTLQRKGSGPVKGQSITLYGNGESDNVTFDATFPECDFSNAFKRVGWDYKEEVEDRFAFRYDSTEKDCVLFLWWNKTDRGIKQLRQTDEWKIDSDSIVSAENSDNKQFVFKNGRMSLGYPRAPVCAPSFEDGALLFTVEIPPKYCNATLVFHSDLPPPTSAATFDMVVITPEATVDLSHTPLILIIVCSSVGGLLLLLGLAAFFYWFWKCHRRRRREKTAIEKEEDMVHDPLDPLKFIPKSEKESRRREEKEALEDVIGRLRENKTLPWERMLQNNEPLTSEDIYDKEIAEAEWRWIYRRNLALQKNEPYDWDKETEEQMKALEDAGREKELREFKTYLSRPALYKRFLDEKDIALRRFNCRYNGITQPSYSEKGCRFTKFERNISRELPQPMDEDWLKEPETKEKTDVVGSERKKSTPLSKKKSSPKKKSEKKSEYDDRPTPENTV